MLGLSIGIRAGRAGAAPPPPPPPATPAGFAMTQLGVPNRIYQRDTTGGGGQGKGQGNVAVTLNVATPGTLYARCRSAADGTTIVQPPWLAIASVAAGAGARAIPGVDARRGWFFLDLSGDGTSWSLGTTPIGMGALVLMAGQSLVVRMFRSLSDGTTIGASGVAIPADGRLFVQADSNTGSVPTSWDQPADGGPWSGAGAPELMNRLIALGGVNVGLVSKCEGQTAIGQWQAGTTYGDALIATMQAAGGQFEAVIWYQGHSDSQAGATIGTYQGQLTRLFATIRANNGFAAPAELVSAIPNVNNGTAWGTAAAIEAIRRASASWAAANGATYVGFNDIALAGDGTHPLQAGAIRQARHFYRALRPHFGAAGDDRGATLGTPTRSGAIVSIPFALTNNATALAMIGSPATRFKIFRGGDRASPLALDAASPIAIDNGARTITLRLASDPGETALDILPYAANDPDIDGAASLIVDDATDGDGIAQGRPLFASAFPARIGLSRDLALGGSPAFGPGRFGNTLTAGYGDTTLHLLPSAGEGFAIEAWVRVGTPDGGLKVLVGADGAFYLYVQGNALGFNCGGQDRSYAGALPTGTWVWVRAVVDAPFTSFVVHIDGVAQAAVAIAPPSPPGWNLRVRGFGHVGGFELTTQDVDEVALWRGAGPPIAGVPTAPYAGTEPGLIGLWHLNGDGLNSATAL